MTEPTEVQVDAVLAFLDEEDGPPFGHANVRDFFPADEPAPPGPETEARLAALQAADNAASTALREWARRLAEAVLCAERRRRQRPADDRRTGHRRCLSR